MDIERLEKFIRGRTPGVMDRVREYAVLVPLVEREGEPCLLYEVRARTLRRQPGEVCFPGGRIEGDESPEQCALRETWEELGIPPESVRVLGPLDFIAHRANFVMYPVLGLVDAGATGKLRRNPAEVDKVFFVPLSELLGTEPQEYQCRLISEMGEDFPYERVGIPRDYRRQPGWDNIPVYFCGGEAIWGLTGRITRHLVSLLREAEREKFAGRT